MHSPQQAPVRASASVPVSIPPGYGQQAGYPAGQPAGQQPPSGPVYGKAAPTPPPKQKKRRGRGVLVTLMIFIVVLGLGLVGVAVLQPDRLDALIDSLRGQEPGPTPTETVEALPGPVLGTLTSAGEVPLPDAAEVKKILEPLVTSSQLGSDVSAAVTDLATGKALYGHAATKMVTPASNMKIASAAALLVTRGPEHRIATRVVAGPQPGEVVLIGAGDATLGVTAATRYYPGAASLDDLAKQVKKALGGTAPTKVIIDGSLFSGPLLGPAWKPDAPKAGYVGDVTALMLNGSRVSYTDREQPFDRYEDNELSAGREFAKLLGLPSTAVAKGRAPAEPAAPASAAPAAAASPGASAAPPVVPPGGELGRVRSAPMLRMIEQMMAESDNTLTDTLARQVALAKGKPASFAGVSEAMTEVLTELGVPAAQMKIADASGFSKDNKLTPTALTTMLVVAADGKHPPLGDLFNTLPVGGWSGTMDYRFKLSKSGFGVVRAKSGSLDGVNTISGVVQTADGRLLAFSVLANEVPLLQHPAQDELDKIPAALALCGCR